MRTFAVCRAGVFAQRGSVLLGVLIALAACSKQSAETAAADGFAAAAPPLAAPAGTYLAYEHTATVELDQAKLSARIDALQQACQRGRFGDCAVLKLSRQGGERASAKIQVRLAPKGVEPFIALAGQDGEVAERESHAEDLAQQVADTRLTQARLQREHAQLTAYQQRSDMKVADLLAVSKRLAEIEAAMEQAERDAAQQRRRIDTQRVTVQLETSASQRGRSQIGQAWANFGETLSGSAAFMISAVAALLPIVVTVGLLVWIVSALMRWRRRKR